MALGQTGYWIKLLILFDKLGATDEQLDFPVIYTSALRGYAGIEEGVREGDMTPLFETIVNEVSPPEVDEYGPLQMQVSTLDYNSYVGIIGIGRIKRGTVKCNMPVSLVDIEGKRRKGKISQVYSFHGLDRIDVESASAGDIVAIHGDTPHQSEPNKSDNPRCLYACVYSSEKIVFQNFSAKHLAFCRQRRKICYQS